MSVAWRSMVLAAAALAAGGCSRQVEEAAVRPTLPSCPSSRADPRSLDEVSGLEGDYTLILTVHDGERAGSGTVGDLTLARRDSAGVPLYGWTDVDLTRIGAHQLGSLDSRDMDAPGVLVLTTRSTDDPGSIRSVTLRLGSNANRSGMAVFDGAYTALHVRWIERDAFGGEWASGVQGPEASGSFCAVRDGSSD